VLKIQYILVAGQPVIFAKYRVNRSGYDASAWEFSRCCRTNTAYIFYVVTPFYLKKEQ